MGTNTPKKNRNDQTAAEQTLIDGFNKHAATIPSIVIAGASDTTKDIVATLQSRIDSAKAALSTRATWQTAVQADRTMRDKTKTFVSGLKQALLVAFAGQIDTLADFGLTAAQTARRDARGETRRGRQGQGDPRGASHHGQEAESRNQRHGRSDRAGARGPSAPTPIATPPAAPRRRRSLRHPRRQLRWRRAASVVPANPCAVPTPVAPAPTPAAPRRRCRPPPAAIAAPATGRRRTRRNAETEEVVAARPLPSRLPRMVRGSSGGKHPQADQ